MQHSEKRILTTRAGSSAEGNVRVGEAVGGLPREIAIRAAQMKQGILRRVLTRTKEGLGGPLAGGGDPWLGGR